MNKKPFGRILLSALVGMVAFVSLPAKANIALTPTIVLIKPGQRYADVHIVNTTNSPQSYEISWKHYKMQEGTGSYAAAESSATDFDLAQNIVFTPRRVLLPPKGAQKVRLAVRLKQGAPPAGDYRAHLSLMNKARGPSNTDEEVGPRENAAMVGMNVGFSIPVVYRVGDDKGAPATIGNVTTRINPKTNKIEAIIPVTRGQGNYGVIGRLTVNYNGKKVGDKANANIFPEINGRVFEVPLNIQVLSGGSLEVVYSDYFLEKERPLDKKIVKIAQ